MSHLINYLEHESTVEQFCKDYAVDLQVAKAVLALAEEGMELLLKMKAA